MLWTFDDGPSRWTPHVLDVLAEADVKARFFVLGEAVEERPELVRRMELEGHVVGNHSWNHPKLTELSQGEVKDQLRLCSEAIVRAGARYPVLFRPPHRDTDARVERVARSLGMEQVLWDVDPRDWEKPGAEAIEARVREAAGAGRTVLLHDGGGDRSQTVVALSRLLGVVPDTRGVAWKNPAPYSDARTNLLGMRGGLLLALALVAAVAGGGAVALLGEDDGGSEPEDRAAVTAKTVLSEADQRFLTSRVCKGVLDVKHRPRLHPLVSDPPLRERKVVKASIADLIAAGNALGKFPSPNIRSLASGHLKVADGMDFFLRGPSEGRDFALSSLEELRQVSERYGLPECAVR